MTRASKMEFVMRLTPIVLSAAIAAATMASVGQGEAYVQRGAVERARRNLQRVQTLCGRNACPQAQQLAAVIQRGPPADVLAAQRPEQGAPPATPTPRPN